ncbi:MAG: aminotransferase class I/II-fold pyridoxal phosphate-dependent enzyme [Lachnospiraceae bacterium]|nr:aminotransferase class I/II-fold pyridoxal phosphate-dependent enzyme [Lachnospiraceae bacterium]
MSIPLNRQVLEMKPSGIRKYFDVIQGMEGAISLGVGEPDFDTPWHIRDEGIYALEKGRTHYTSNAGLMELKEEICAYMQRTQKLPYAPEDVFVTVGGSEAIDLCMRAMLNPGDEVLIPQPSYVSYEPCVVWAQGKPVIIELDEAHDFRLQPEQMLEKITDRTRMLVLPYPNNPTGAIMTKEDLAPIAKICVEKDIYVLSDEIYGELTYEGSHVSIASLPGMRERTIIASGFSKAFAMTGWRLGYALGPAEIIAQMLKVHQYAIMCAPTMSQFAGIEALRNGAEDVRAMRDEFNRRRRFLLNAFREMDLPCFTPYGAFYVFPCIKKYGCSSDDFAMRLLEEEKLAVVPGTAFGDCGEGFLRISYAYSLDNLKRAMERLKRFTGRLS